MIRALLWGGSLAACSAVAYAGGHPWLSGLGAGCAVVVAIVEVIEERVERRRR